MFVPVACLKCGKAFQVADTAAGTDVPCPWCKQITSALPVVLTPGNPALNRPLEAQPEPLSLDEAPAAVVSRQVAAPAASPAEDTRKPERTPLPWRTAAVVLLVSVAVGFGTFFLMKAIRRPPVPAPPPQIVAIADAQWAAFTPPGEAWSAELPGSPDLGELPLGVGGKGQQYIVYDSASGWAAWVGWRELEAEWIGKARSKAVSPAKSDDPRFLLEPIFTSEKARLAKTWDVQESGRRTLDGEPLTVEVVMSGANRKLVERIIVVPHGPHPRVYFVGLMSPDLDPRGPVASRLLASFRVR